MGYIVKGIFPTIPHKAKWWGIEVHDGRNWLKCEEPADKGGKGKPVRWWPTSTLPSPEFVGASWGSGWYRITWTSHDKRKTLTVSEPFAVIDNADPNLANLLSAMAGGPADHNLLNPEQVMNLPPHMAPSSAELRCTHCGRSEGETPLATFQTMFLLLDKHLDRQAEAMRNQHQMAIEDLRSNQQVALEQTRMFWQQMHEMSLAPRLAALESQLTNLFDDGDVDMGNSTTAAIIGQLAKDAGPAVALLAQKYLERQKTPPKLNNGGNDSA